MEGAAQEYREGFSQVQYDGTYFYAVADERYQIVKLNKQGKVMATFGNKGRGPGEFSSPHVDLLLTNDLLYVLDSRGMTITIINPQTFNAKDQRLLKKPVSGLISYQTNIYSSVNILEKEAFMKAGKMTEAYRNIEGLADIEATLFNLTDPQPINPFYDSEKIYSNNESAIILQEGKRTLSIFRNDSLYRRRIPGIEPLALGKKIEEDEVLYNRPLMKMFWKKKIMPAYYLHRSAYLAGDKLYLQLKSYKKGSPLVAYDFTADRFETIGALSQGELLAVDGDTIYTMDDQKSMTTTLDDISSCSRDTVRFYFKADAFGENCTSCKESFMAWYEYTRKHNIPVQLVLEDDSWFGSKEVEISTVKPFLDRGIWGTVSYTKNCDSCFESPITARISSMGEDSNRYALHESLSTLEEELECIAK